MSSVRLLVLRRMVEHRARLVLSVGGIAVGAGLAVAVLGFLGSLTGSVARFVEDLAGPADLEVEAAAPGGFEERLYFTIQDTAGVASAVPLVAGQVEVGGSGALLIGLDGRAAALGTALARGQVPKLGLLSGRPGIFLGAPLAAELGVDPGESVTVSDGSGGAAVTVLGTLSGGAGNLNGGRFAATSIPVAQALLGRLGRLDTVLVVATPGTEVSDVQARLADRVGAVAVVRPPDRRVVEARAATAVMRTGMLMGVAMALVVGAFLVYNTMSMAAQERRKELATLRALGGRRRRLLGLFLLEAGLIGLAGSAIGVLAGIAVSERLVEGIPPAVASVAAELEVAFLLPAHAVPLALAAGVAASLTAAALPAWRAVTVPPVEAMRPEGVSEGDGGGGSISWPVTVTGGVLGAAGFAVATTGPPAAGLAGVVALFAGVIVASYGLTAVIARTTSVLASPLGVGGRLASTAVERSPRRAWAGSAAVVAATAMVVAQTGLFDNLTRSLEAAFAGLGAVDLYVSAQAPDTAGPGRGLPGDWADDLEALPGVAQVGAHAVTQLSYRNRRVVLRGLERPTGSEPEVARLSPGDRARLERGSGAVVSTHFSRLSGLGRGDALDLPTPAGPRRLAIVGVVPLLGADGGQVTIGRKALVEWFGHGEVSDYLLTLEAGIGPAGVRRAVARFASLRSTPVFLQSGGELIGAIRGVIGQTRALFTAMTTVVVGAAALGILNALLISVVERRRELGIMRALGTSRRQLRRMVMLEAGALGLVGGVAGAVVGFVLHRASIAPLLAPFTEQTGLTVEYELLLAPAAAAVAIGVVISVAGSILPSRRAGAINVVEAIGYE